MIAVGQPKSLFDFTFELRPSPRPPNDCQGKLFPSCSRSRAHLPLPFHFSTSRLRHYIFLARTLLSGVTALLHSLYAFLHRHLPTSISKLLCRVSLQYTFRRVSLVMAESQPRPPAPVPSSPNETSSVGSTRMTSPTNSVGTDRTVKAPEPPKAMDFAPYGRAAVLSTNLGRQPAREPPGPPFPPVILHSNKITGVFHYASYWRNKHPKIYHSFFPDSGWTITDLWDDADIHLESPSFLEEVLGFICRDNAHRANVYVYEWSKAHPEKLDMIGGDMSQIYDIHRPAAIVDKIFTDGETKQYPHMFLWHVFRNMRICMAIAVKKQQALQATAKTQGVVKADGEGMNSLKSGAPWATGKPDTVERVKQLQPASSPAVAPRKASPKSTPS